MKPRNLVTAVFICLLGLPVLLSLMTGCESSPQAPVFENPFDPDSEIGGDPLQVTAALGDTVIRVSWTQPQTFNITSYDIYHSFSSFGDFISVGNVGHTTDAFNFFNYPNPEPTRTHFFKVRAYAGDDFSIISEQVPAMSITPPLVTFGDGSGQTPTRHLSLLITVSSGDSLRVADNPDFTGQVTVPVTTPGLPDAVAWNLGPVAGNDTSLTLYVLAEPANGLRDTAIVDVDVDFAPAFGIVGDPATVGTQSLDLYIPLGGVEQMRFANSLGSLENQAWRAAQDTLRQYNITTSANPQTIYGEFAGDFGFNTITELDVIPDLLTDVTFRLDLPADHITDQSTVIGLCNAKAMLMRFSESLDFSTVVWQGYSDQVEINLSSGPGQKVIHAQFRNSWADSPILTDYVIYLIQPLEVAFLSPTEGDIVMAGATLQIQGTSTATSGTAPVDSVKFDGGDGFAPVSGTTNWTTLWTAPRFDTDTSVVLLARAWAGDDSTTTVLNVTVTQPLVSITTPTADSQVTGDTDVDVTGTASAATGGAPIDSVVVDIDGVLTTAVGTDSWSLTWHPDAVTEDTPAVIIATAWADGHSAADTTGVTVIPAESP